LEQLGATASTFWQAYCHYAYGLAAVSILGGLVAMIVKQGRHRRSAESRLADSENAMRLAVEAAGLTVWSWDIERDEIALALDRLALLPQGDGQVRRLEDFLREIHPADRPAVRHAIERTLAGEGTYESEYRKVDAAGAVRWFAGRGQVERLAGKPRWFRGATLDITRRKEAELEAQARRDELAHLARVSQLGELSSSIAHELAQPLMAILGNAQAARLLLNREPVDLMELTAIVDDIIEHDKRAAGIIGGLRRMLKKEPSVHVPLDVNEVVREVVAMTRGDLANRGVTLVAELAPSPPMVNGDRVQLQQVVLNLIVNGCDAMAAYPREQRTLTLRTEIAGDRVKLCVSDLGVGIKATEFPGLCKPFFTTKTDGLGLGLSVCSSIICAHGGELSAANNDGGGATFTMVMQAREPVPA
jgi:signal transduction histidine kinase